MDNEEHSEGFGATGGEEQNSSNLAWKSLKRGFGTGGGRNWGALLLGCIDYCPRINMSWNVFQLCAGLKVIGSLMIFLVVSIVGVSYYAVVIANYTPQVLKGGSAATMATALLVLILFHVLLAMLLWSYFAVVFTDPGGVPQGWRPSSSSSEDDLEMQSSPLVDQTAEMMTVAASLEITPQSANVRYCKICRQFKPPRCHHCSVCGRCILKMDHHCIWVVNCVGAHNYKFFLLFLLYTFLETTLVTVALLPPFINFFGDIEEDSSFPNDLATTLLGLVLNLVFALSLLGFLIMHMSLVAGNTTTIETSEKKASARWRFDLGWKRNFEQVFGMRKLYWFLPLYADDDLRQMTVLKGKQKLSPHMTPFTMALVHECA
ncbi:unnamed protein product [Sphagnum jensenii]|uniref:S-acyltransferase n=1 Tax=Sphagnum jensenii TaxID=128206 RepID=A0ABP0XAM8_9BRYO